MVSKAKNPTGVIDYFCYLMFSSVSITLLQVSKKNTDKHKTFIVIKFYLKFYYLRNVLLSTD